MNFKLKVHPTVVTSSWIRYQAFRRAGTAHVLGPVPGLRGLSPQPHPRTHLWNRETHATLLPGVQLNEVPSDQCEDENFCISGDA